MKKNLYYLYHRTLSKYKKFKSRYDNGLKTGRFFELSHKKRELVVKRIKRLKQQLEKLKIQLKLAAAGSALAIALSSAPVQAQQLGPFIEVPLKNPLPPPPSSPSFSNRHPAIVDIDNDGDLDVFVGRNSGSIIYYRNDGTADKPYLVRLYSTDNPLDGIDVGDYATPTFADMDKDGDLDLVVGEQNQFAYDPNNLNNINYFENTGTVSAPVFSTLPATGPHPTDDIHSDLPHGHPSFVDIDNDGDLDAFVGGNQGYDYNYGPSPGYRETITFWRNNGVTPMPDFTRESGSTNPVSIINPEFGGVLDRAAPVFTDIDNDGDSDMFVGDYNGNIRFFRNDGTASAPSFPAEIVGAQNPFDGIDVGSYASPEFADFDNDGDMDAIVGKYSYPTTHISYFENIGDATSPQFVERIGIQNFFDGIDLGYDTSPTTLDIDSDGDLDLIIGAKYNPETLYLFENNGDGTFSERTGTANPFDNLLGSISADRPVPEFADIDDDGDMDLFVGLTYFSGPSNAQIRFFRNDGTNNFTADTSPIATNYNYTYFAQTLGDFDGDGDLDAVIGSNVYSFTPNASFIYLENQGSAASPTFVEQPTTDPPFGGINIEPGYNSFPKPNFVDLDHDGDLDVVSGVHAGGSPKDGKLLFFQNVLGVLSEITAANDPFPVTSFKTNDSDPTFIDIDNDGDLDVIVGNSYGQIEYLENQNLPPQTNSNPSTGNFTEGDAAQIIDAAVDIFDATDDDIIMAQIAIVSNYVMGEDVLDVTLETGFTGSFNTSTGVYTIMGYGKIATYRMMLQSATYLNTNLDNPNPASRTVEFAVTDFDNTDPYSDSFPEFQKSIDITPVNDPPTLMASAGATTFTEDAGPVVVEASISITDVDNTNLESATISITGNFTTGEDELLFTAQNGISGSYNPTAGILTLTGTATLAQYQTALQSITYQNTSDNPDLSTRTIDFQVFDGTDNSTVASKNMDVIPTNDAPSVTTSGGNSLFTEGDSPLAIDNGLSLNDADNTTLESATVSITNNFTVGEDELLFTDENGITNDGYNQTTGVLSLSGTASVANYQAALRKVAYENTSEDPNGTTRTVEFQVFDGTDNSTIASKNMDVAPVNDPPVLSSSNAGTDINYTQNAQSVVIDDQITISDLDDTNFAGATISIANSEQGDNLVFTEVNNITGSYSNGALTLMGSDSEANYLSVLQSIQFETSEGAGSRSIEFIINDGTNDSAPYSRNVNIQDAAVTNQPPNVDTTPATTQLGSIITIDLCNIISDPDNNYSELTVTVLSISSGAATAIDGCELTVDYSGTDFSGEDQIVIEACDPSGDCDQNSLNIMVEEPPASQVEVFNAVSPNNDGANDWWIINGLDTPNTIELYNRWGDLVKTLTNYQGDQNTPNNALDDLPAATYFYKLESAQGSFTGYIVIKK